METPSSPNILSLRTRSVFRATIYFKQTKFLTVFCSSVTVNRGRIGGTKMKPIELEKVQKIIDGFKNKEVYVHLETTNGAYASHINKKAYNVGAYIRNAKVSFNQAKIVGDGKSYRVGLKMEMGWIYAEGLTDWTIHEDSKLLMAGHDREGRLMVSLQISETPFSY